MTELQSPARPFDRILVALDASPHSRAALEMAVQIAADFQAELDGLFVKDENLLRAAQLPFAAEVRSYSLSPRRLNDRRVERQLRYQAQRAEAVLQDLTEHAEVSYDFRVAEGHVTEELLAAAENTDLLAMGKTSTRSSRRRLGTTSQRLLAEAPAPVLVLRRSVRQPRPILTYYDGSDRATSALQIAAQLASRPPERPLTVFLPPGGDAELIELRDDVYSRYGSEVPHLQVRPLAPAEVDRFAGLARDAGPALLVLPDECSPLAGTALDRFLYETDEPLLMVR